MQGLTHAHGAILVVVQTFGQVFDALVSQRIALGLLSGQLALALAVVQEEPQAKRPEQRQKYDCNL
ncbi:hypothetical protein D3C84_1147100 [compost metagenome]